MPIVKLKIDISGTVGDEVWRNLRQFDQIERASIRRGSGSGRTCNHPVNAPHLKGEWISADIQVKTPLLAQYAVSHYLEQERVLDADVVD
jgi:hypothetical protein